MNPKLNGHATKKDPTAGLDTGDQIASLMTPYYEALARIAFDDAGTQHGLDVSFSLDNPFVQTTLKRLAKQVRRVTDETQRQIAELVGRQADAGWSNDQLAREVRKLGVDMSRSRSITIARTESASGYTGGAIASFQASGVVSETQWLMGPDSCDICIALDGTRAALGESYPGGFDGPPAHPRCVCVLTPIVE